MTHNFGGNEIEIEISREITERTCNYLHNKSLFRVVFWEISGKDRVVKFISSYCLGSNVVIVMFDVNKVSSFNKAEKILKEIEICDIPYKILVGNKIDIQSTKKSEIVIQQPEIDKLARTYNCEYIPCNATLVDAVNQIYEHKINYITGIISENLDLENLINKNIMVGNRFYLNPNYIKSMKNSSYFKEDVKPITKKTK